MSDENPSASDPESSKAAPEPERASPPARAEHPRGRFGCFSVVLISAIVAIAAGGGGYYLATKQRSSQQTAAVKYQCPMHPTIVQDHPGECPICGMKLVKVGGGPEAKERKIKFYRSPMDPKQTSPTPRKDEMGMDYVPVYEDEVDTTASGVPGLATVEIDPARQQLIGLKTAPVTRGKVTGAWRTFSKISVDEQRVRHVNVKVPVFVEHVYVNFVGKPVRKGEALFSGYSPELLAAQAEYQVALSTQQTLAGATGSATDNSSFLKASRRRLELWDMSEAAIRKLERGGEPLRTLTFSSPIEGVVTKKDVVDGMKIDAGSMPYEVVDLSKVWVLADVYESDIHRVRVGMKGTLKLKAYPNRSFEGVSTFIDPVLDPAARTVKMRLEFANPSGELKPGMFGEITLETVAREGLRIAEDAVINSGTRKVVFVALGQGKLQPREVVLGDSSDGNVEVISGVSEGEMVVVRANFLVDSESQLRASLAALMDSTPAPSTLASGVPSASASIAPPTASSSAPAPKGTAPPKPTASTSISGAASGSATPATIYSCPMHPEVTDTKPSRCPKCGMYLTPKQ